MERTTIDFGIDLGTTNSTIAVIDEIDAKVIPNKVGSTITPSAVWIDKRGGIRVGQEAKLRALGEDSDNGDLEFKLRMGCGDEGLRTFERSGPKMTPEELSAEVLKSLKLDVQTSMGEDLRAAVITVPAAFENSQTNATMKAAKLAGFSTSPLLLEPVAASLAYGFQSESENAYWMVYDFGGGTFDAAVMRIRDGLIQVVNHDGDNYLGGKLIDWELINKKLIPALTDQYNLPNFQQGNDRWRIPLGKLKYFAEQTKIEVCRSKAPQELWIESLCEDADEKEIDFAFTMTPADIEEISKPYIEQSLTLCRKTLDQVGLHGSDMERILMVGGSTLNPFVREAVAAEFDSQLEFGIDPITVVARGAAIFASTQTLARDETVQIPAGTWRIEIEHRPVGNVEDPDIGGRIVASDGQSIEGYTIELVDTKTRWRSGRITLGPDGVFMTQLFAEKQSRHEYEIELCDGTGSRVMTSPDRVTYTLGVIPEENPPAAHSIGIGLANGSVATYVKKGARLPARKSIDHYTTIALQAGGQNDELRIPLLEGEHSRAERNHGIGTMVVKGTQLHRDLPSGSQIEISVTVDKDQQVRVDAYVPSLDEDLPQVVFDSQSKHNSVEELSQQVSRQRTRLTNAIENAERTSDSKAKSALDRLRNEQTVEHVEDLLERAQRDPDAISELDRKVRGLEAAIDEIEDAVEWPLLVEKANEARADAEKVADDHGESSDRNRLRSLNEELQHAIDAGDPDVLRRQTESIESLCYDILRRQPGFHVGTFNWLVDKLQSMRDPGQAEQIVTQGRRALNNNDIEALKAANRQLMSLLPRDVQDEARHANVGGTMTHGD